VHADIAGSLHNLGVVCHDEGDHKGAREYYKQALAMYRRVHGAEAAHADIAQLLQNLGSVCGDEGDYKGARECYEQSLAMYRRVHGAEAAHANIASSLQNLGVVCRAEGDNKGARECYEQSLAMYRRLYGADAVHADIAKSLQSLGALRVFEADQKGAREYFEQALAMYTKVLPAQHPKIKLVEAALKMVKPSLQQTPRHGIHSTTHREKPSTLPLVGVLCCGLQSKPEWNGQQGSIRGYDKEEARYQVRVDGPHGGDGNVRPANVLLPVGTAVVIMGLLKAPQWNGKHGSIAAFDAPSGRYAVRIEGQSAVLKLKLENVLARAAVV
jgi:tetratricopeptide (TPR) repeat protein